MLLLQESEAELEDEVDILMSSDIMAAQMSTKNITFSRAQSGWLFREDKTVRELKSYREELVVRLLLSVCVRVEHQHIKS